jgi:hypothetical protein
MNVEKPTIQFTAGSHSVSITLHEPYGPMADELHARVVARSGAFRGELTFVASTFDLHALYQLLVSLDAVVGQPNRKEWQSMEGELTLTFELTQVGHVLLHVELLHRSDDWSLPTTLKYVISADQTYLPLWIGQVAQALESMTL